MAHRNIAFVCDEQKQLDVFAAVSLELGCSVAVDICDHGRLLRELDGVMIDTLVVATDRISGVLLTSFRTLLLHNPVPILMYDRGNSNQQLDDAIQAGVCQVAMGVVTAETFAAGLAAAESQFRARNHLAGVLQETKKELVNRRLIERAKYLVMEKLEMNEPQAHLYLRKEAMNSRMTLLGLAERVLDLAGSSAPE